MTCPNCSRAIEDESVYCRYCGVSVGVGAQGTSTARRLTRRPEDGWLAGVCAGIAAYTSTDVTIVRLIWVVLSIVPGGIIGGVIAYVAAWLLMPEASPAERPAAAPRRLFRSTVDRKVAGVCGGIAEYFGADATIVRLITVILAIYPGAIILGVIAYGIAWVVIPLRPDAPMHPAPTAA